MALKMGIRSTESMLKQRFANASRMSTILRMCDAVVLLTLEYFATGCDVSVSTINLGNSRSCSFHFIERMRLLGCRDFDSVASNLPQTFDWLWFSIDPLAIIQESNFRPTGFICEGCTKQMVSSK